MKIHASYKFLLLVKVVFDELSQYKVSENVFGVYLEWFSVPVNRD